MDLPKLTLEVANDVIFYDINWTRNAGEMGYVFPGGQVYAVAFDELADLGSGVHSVELDEGARVARNEPESSSPIDDDVLTVRFYLFLDKIRPRGDTFRDGHAFTAILRAFRPSSATRVGEYLSDSQLAELNDYAVQVGKNPASIFYLGAGSEVSLPPENLQAIRSYCHERKPRGGV